MEQKYAIIFGTKSEYLKNEIYYWKYSGIIKFLYIMRNFEDYSCPFDYYTCNSFEKSLNLKHYWSANQFFIQGSNTGLCPSTLR